MSKKPNPYKTFLSNNHSHLKWKFQSCLKTIYLQHFSIQRMWVNAIHLDIFLAYLENLYSL